MHSKARRSATSAAARDTESGRRRNVGFTASLRSSRFLGLLVDTWELGGKNKSGSVKFGEQAVHGRVLLNLVAAQTLWSIFHEIVRVYSGWGPIPKAALQVYRNNPKGIEDLNNAVKPAVRRLPLSVCHVAAEAALCRAKLCIERNTLVISNVSSKWPVRRSATVEIPSNKISLIRLLGDA